MTQVLAQHLEDALALCGFDRTERFQVMRITGAKPKTTATAVRTTDVAAAMRFVARNPVDVYLALNPVKPDADPPGGAAREEDMACARMLNVDVDPLDTTPEARAAARELALAVRNYLAEIGAKPALIDSGRGQQLWLPHGPISAAELAHGNAELRHVFLRGLAHKFKSPLAHVDEAPWGARFSGRLPGTKNSKTGELVRALKPGDGRILPWGTLVDLAGQWAKVLPPPKEGPKKLPPELKKVIDELPGKPDAWRWLGATSARTGGLHDLVRPAVPPAHQGHFDEGAGEPHRRWSRPGDEAFTKRAVRAVEALLKRDERAGKVATARTDVQILSITRHTEGVGRAGWIDLELRVRDAVATIRRLDGKEILSYAAVRARAAVQGALLPDLEKEARAVWNDMLAQAWAAQKVEQVREGTTHQAIVDAIRETLRQAKTGRTASDLVCGRAVQVGESIAIHAPELVAGARNKMLPDVVSREQVLEAARELGADPTARPVLPDGSRRRAWLFPVSAIAADD